MIETRNGTPVKPGCQHYCGPSALAAATRRCPTTVAAWINVDRGLPCWRQVKGTSPGELTYAAKQLGYRMRRVRAYRRPGRARPEQRRGWFVDYDRSSDARPTLNQWIRGDYEGDRLWAKRLIVDVGHHWVAIHQGKLADSHSSREWGRALDSPHAKKRVRRVYVLEELDTKLARRRRGKHEPTPPKALQRRLARRGRRRKELPIALTDLLP